ncbi:MAG: hypothetical protein GH151_15255 [Bacteroidetes bacterium]|nr:hypothetical protein [Bacteroidota bacterium]
MKNVRITVRGRVQNVGFRYFTFETANMFNIKGLVKNEMDGSVYIEAEGEEPDVDLFIEHVKQGPSWAIIYRFYCEVSGSGRNKSPVNSQQSTVSSKRTENPSEICSFVAFHGAGRELRTEN